MVEYAKYKNYIKSNSDNNTASILLVNAYIGKNKDLQNGLSIKELNTN